MEPLVNRPLGKFLKLPFEKWLTTDSAPYDKMLSKASDELLQSPTFLSCLGSQYMPTALLERLTGPSQPDLNMPAVPFKRYDVTLGNDSYGFMSWVNEEQMADRKIAKMAIKGNIACYLHCFFYHYLTAPHEIISTFHNPAAQQELTPENCLAIGIMREVLILPRFQSMYHFWMKHEAMMKEGGKLLGFYISTDFNSDVVFDHIKDDPEATKMYQICLDIGMPSRSFSSGMNRLCYQFGK